MICIRPILAQCWKESSNLGGHSMQLHLLMYYRVLSYEIHAYYYLQLGIIRTTKSKNGALEFSRISDFKTILHREFYKPPFISKRVIMEFFHFSIILAMNWAGFDGTKTRKVPHLKIGKNIKKHFLLLECAKFKKIEAWRILDLLNSLNPRYSRSPFSWIQYFQ